MLIIFMNTIVATLIVQLTVLVLVAITKTIKVCFLQQERASSSTRRHAIRSTIPYYNYNDTTPYTQIRISHNIA